MINVESLKLYSSEFNKSDKNIIYDYFLFADEREPFSESSIKTTKWLINKLLKNRTIKELDFDFIHYNFEKIIGVRKKQFYKFMFFLCYKKYIPYCNFYRLLRLEKYVFCSHSYYAFDYWIDLDKQYYDLFLKSQLVNGDFKHKLQLLFFHLDKNKFIDSNFYEICNDTVEQIKFISTKKPLSLLSELNTLRLQLYYISNILPSSFTATDFITVTQAKWIKHTYFFHELFTLLDLGGYLNNKLVRDTIQLLSSVYKDFNQNYYYLIPQIIESRKPKQWVKMFDKKLLFYNCSNPETFYILKEFSKQLHHGESYLEVFLKDFDNSISNPYSSLSYYTYVDQIKFFSGHSYIKNSLDKKELLTLIHSFYTFYQNYIPDVFIKDGYPTALLTTIGIAQKISRGFEVVNYNPIAEIPASDKWIFCFKDPFSPHLIQIKTLDLTKIYNPIFRGWYKNYIWHTNTKMVTVIHRFKNIRESLNYISDLKSGKKISFFTFDRNEDYSDISSPEIRAFKTYVLNTYSHPKSRVNYCQFSIL